MNPRMERRDEGCGTGIFAMSDEGAWLLSQIEDLKYDVLRHTRTHELHQATYVASLRKRFVKNGHARALRLVMMMSSFMGDVYRSLPPGETMNFCSLGARPPARPSSSKGYLLSDVTQAISTMIGRQTD